MYLYSFCINILLWTSSISEKTIGSFSNCGTGNIYANLNNATILSLELSSIIIGIDVCLNGFFRFPLISNWCLFIEETGTKYSMPFIIKTTPKANLKFES